MNRDDLPSGPRQQEENAKRDRRQKHVADVSQDRQTVRSHQQNAADHGEADFDRDGILRDGREPRRLGEQRGDVPLALHEKVDSERDGRIVDIRRPVEPRHSIEGQQAGGDDRDELQKSQHCATPFMIGAASDNSGENPGVRIVVSRKSERVCDPAHGAVRSREEAESY
jgi:hypothetical protein